MRIYNSVIKNTKIDNSILTGHKVIEKCNVNRSEVYEGFILNSDFNNCLFKKPVFTDSNLNNSRFIDCPQPGKICVCSQHNFNLYTKQCPPSDKCVPWVPPETPDPQTMISSSASTQDPQMSSISTPQPPASSGEAGAASSFAQPSAHSESVSEAGKAREDRAEGADGAVAGKKQGGSGVIVSSVCGVLALVVAAAVVTFFVLRRRSEAGSYKKDEEDPAQTI